MLPDEKTGGKRQEKIMLANLLSFLYTIIVNWLRKMTK